MRFNWLDAYGMEEPAWKRLELFLVVEEFRWNSRVSKGFWDFSFDDIGTYDVPCAIDFVLQQTGYDQLTLVGWSQGSTNVFVTLSLRPEYNAKVSSVLRFTI